MNQGRDASIGRVVSVLGGAKAKADTFRLVTGSGYGAFGVVDRGNVTVSGGGLLGR